MDLIIISPQHLVSRTSVFVFNAAIQFRYHQEGRKVQRVNPTKSRDKIYYFLLILLHLGVLVLALRHTKLFTPRISHPQSQKDCTNHSINFSWHWFSEILVKVTFHRLLVGKGTGLLVGILG